MSTEFDIDLQTTLYVGNDLNDLKAMQECGFTACPSDAHPMIQDLAKYKLKTKGGEGVAREILESILHYDLLSLE